MKVETNNFDWQYDKITETKYTSFQTEEGEVLYGVYIKTDRGDNFGHWSPIETETTQFKIGRWMHYRLKRVIRDDKQTIRLEDYMFRVPRKIRAEAKIVDNMMYLAKDVVQKANELYVATTPDKGKWNPEHYTKVYKHIYSLVKHTILNETYQIDGSREQ